jgi:hypothetical protein
LGGDASIEKNRPTINSSATKPDSNIWTPTEPQ